MKRVSKSSIDNFLAQKRVAVVGVSRNPQEFANTAYRFLKTHGYTVFPVNPFAERIEGDRCYPNVTALPERIDAALIILPSEKVMDVLPAIIETGVKHIWLQQGIKSDQAVKLCIEHQVNVIYGECILMFAEPVGFPHRFHAWGKKLFGQYPTSE